MTRHDARVGNLVSFCTSSCARCSSSSDTDLSFSIFFRCSFASRRTLRMATRAFSASWRTTLIRSRRRSSVSGGIGTRITSPAVAGFSPRSESRMAFSTTGTIFFSQGCTVIVRASASVTLATWFSGIGEP